MARIPRTEAIFIEQYEDLKSSLGEGEEILFLEAVQLTHNAKTGYDWVLKGLVKQVASHTSRLRVFEVNSDLIESTLFLIAIRIC